MNKEPSIQELSHSYPVVKFSNRKFPGMVIQSDTLFSIWRDLLTVQK